MVVSKPLHENAVVLVARRLADCLDHESARLEHGDLSDLQSQIAWKSRLNFELNRAARELSPMQPDQEMIETLKSLRKALSRNRSAIQANLTAVKELVDIIQDSAVSNMSDGTYQRRRAADF